MAPLAQGADGLVQRPAGVQRGLGEVGVEDDPEVGQGGLDLGEHQLDAAYPEPLLLLVLGQVEDAGLRGHDLCTDVGDVVTGVAVLGHRAARRGGHQAAGEPVDLGPGVVEVVLPADLSPGRGEQPAQRVADRRPPGGPQGHRPGRVGRHELQVHLQPGERVGAAVGLPRRHRVDGDLAQRAGGEGHVEEPRTGHVDPLDTGLLAQVGGQQLGHLAGRPAGLLGQLERHGGGVVAVLGVARALHHDVVGDGDREGAALDGRGDDGADEGTELLGRHRVIVEERNHRLRRAVDQQAGPVCAVTRGRPHSSAT
ncbi:unannotated protein [freshwater metagenome]|uniref:Unannotated protein n=1 Tax=freshwater metagenome TaxID=449393 RepID=A0A6J7GXW9_9ZZZZ